MKPHALAVLTSFILFGCWQDKPKTLSGKTETIEVRLLNWACNCPDFIETKYYRNNPEYSAKEEDCIYIEAANKDLYIPEEYYREKHFDYNLKLTGQFYVETGVSDSYEKKVAELKTQNAKVFRYDKYELVSNKKVPLARD